MVCATMFVSLISTLAMRACDEYPIAIDKSSTATLNSGDLCNAATAAIASDGACCPELLVVVSATSASCGRFFPLSFVVAVVSAADDDDVLVDADVSSPEELKVGLRDLRMKEASRNGSDRRTKEGGGGEGGGAATVTADEEEEEEAVCCR
jgi:hypothetical protein